MTTPEPQIICPNCGYNLAGLAQPQSSSRSCPECGMSGIPANSYLLYTHKDLHDYLFKRLLLITSLPIVGLIIAVKLSKALAALSCMTTIVIPIVIIFLFVSVSSEVLTDSAGPPRRIARWTIPVWVLLYCLPAIALFIYLQYLMY